MAEENGVQNKNLGEGDVISNSNQITPSWLTGVLQKNGTFQHVEVANISARIQPTLVSQLVFLAVSYAEGTDSTAPEKLLLKMNSTNWDKNLSDSASMYSQMGKKEVIFNNTIAPKINPSALVPCYDAVYDLETNRFHILMADLSETHFQTEWPLPPLKRHCELVINAIADVHAACWDNQKLFEKINLQLSPKEDFNQAMAQIDVILPEFLDFLGDRLSSERRRIFERVSPKLNDLIMKRLSIKSGLTLIHGDAHFWNALIPYSTEHETVRMIDWASYRIDNAAIDLTYMMALHWYPERRRRLELQLLKRYYDRLIAGGVSGYDWIDLWHDYRLVVASQIIVPAFQWKNKIPAMVWWSHLERSMLNFEDLDCADLLSG